MLKHPNHCELFLQQGFSHFPFDQVGSPSKAGILTIQGGGKLVGRNLHIKADYLKVHRTGLLTLTGSGSSDGKGQGSSGSGGGYGGKGGAQSVNGK